MNKKFYLYLFPFFCSFLFANQNQNPLIKQELQKDLIQKVLNDQSLMKIKGVLSKQIFVGTVIAICKKVVDIVFSKQTADAVKNIKNIFLKKKKIEKICIDSILKDKDNDFIIEELQDIIKKQEKVSNFVERRLYLIIENLTNQVHDLKSRNDELRSWNIDLANRLSNLMPSKIEDSKKIINIFSKKEKFS